MGLIVKVSARQDEFWRDQLKHEVGQQHRRHRRSGHLGGKHLDRAARVWPVGVDLKLFFRLPPGTSATWRAHGVRGERRRGAEVRPTLAAVLLRRWADPGDGHWAQTTVLCPNRRHSTANGQDHGGLFRGLSEH